MTGAGLQVWTRALPEPTNFFASLPDEPLDLASVSNEDGVAVLIVPGIAQLRLEIRGTSLLWSFSLDAASERTRVWFPFLRAAFATPEPGVTVYGPQTFRDSHGRAIFRHADWPLPISRVAADGSTLTLLLDEFVDVLSPEGIPLEAGARIGGELIAHEGGWPASFNLLRQRVRPQFDLSEYQRPEMAWYNDQLVQHFTFLYGRELFNHATGEFEVQRFLDDAERDFGGYDGFLIWGVYPRIGVDERTQWDFHDDLPGGREGLRSMARQARDRGVRFFIPYKPWDRSADLHGRGGRPDHEELARLVADVEADGVFLDTMSAIDRAFRDQIDSTRSGVVLCSEGRAKGKAFETITGAWDQSPNVSFNEGNWSAVAETMPGVDLWRFIFPEHRQFVINRHAVGDDRIRVIQRGFFSGMGWVVWQDIFGLVLTYSPEEAALLKQCRTLFRQHRQALNSPTPTPLIPTLVPGVYCNEFPADSKRLWTFYNETDETVDAPVVQIQPRAGTHLVDIWNERALTAEADGRITLTLPPHSLGAVVEYPSLLQQTRSGISFSPLLRGEGPGVRADGAQIETLAGAVRLIRDGEIFDQIIIEPRTPEGA